MTGIILDSILMLLLVAAIGYGIKLEPCARGSWPSPPP